MIVGLFLLTWAGCETETTRHANGKVVARVYDQVLTINDVDGLAATKTPADSINLLNNAIQQWITEQLVAEKAKQVLPGSTVDEVNQKVDAYRNELLSFRYEKQLVNQKMDTSISDSALFRYYEQYIVDYLLDEAYLRFVYVKCDKRDLVEEVEAWMKDTIDIHNLEDFCSEELQACHLYPDRWVSLRKFREKLGEVEIDIAQVKLGDRYIKIKDENTHYLIRTLEFRDIGEPAPMSLVRKDVYTILLNRKKAQFLRDFHKELIASESINGNVKIYDDE